MIKSKHFPFYMEVARNSANLSYAKRLKVGAVIVTNTGAMYHGYNGTLPGFENNCEIVLNDELITDEDTVVHAEQNALYKMLNEGVSAKGATVFVTHSCCKHCAKMLISAGVERVVYDEVYRDTKPLDTLKMAGIIVEKHEHVRPC